MASCTRDFWREISSPAELVACFTSDKDACNLAICLPDSTVLGAGASDVAGLASFGVFGRLETSMLTMMAMPEKYS
jgi:hypothetical protein